MNSEFMATIWTTYYAPEKTEVEGKELPFIYADHDRRGFVVHPFNAELIAASLRSQNIPYEIVET